MLWALHWLNNELNVQSFLISKLPPVSLNTLVRVPTGR